MNREPTVFVVDEDASIRKSILDLTRTLGVRCETYASGLTFLDKCAGSSFGSSYGCLVVEARMMGVSGLQIQRRLLSERIPLSTIMMTSQVDIPTVVAAMRNGAIEFLEKPFREQKMWEAIQEALRVGRERSGIYQRRKELGSLLENLTAREREVFQMLGKGKANRGIAEEMGLCVRMIEMYRSKLMTKLEARNLRHLVTLAEFAAEPSPDDEGRMSLVDRERRIRSRVEPGDSHHGESANSLEYTKFGAE